MIIKELTPANSSDYKSFFLGGLKFHEDNFRISIADEMLAPFPTEGTQDSFTLGAFDSEKLVGVVSFQREGRDREKLRHKATLFRMYVDQRYHGKGIGRLLITNVINTAIALQDIEQINLTVISGNAPAKALYEKFGFTTFSTEKNAIKWKGKYHTEEQMVLFLQ